LGIHQLTSCVTLQDFLLAYFKHGKYSADHDKINNLILHTAGRGAKKVGFFIFSAENDKTVASSQE
jgi:hypothetical protein